MTMTKEETKDRALDLFDSLTLELGDDYDEDNRDIWATLGMVIVLWVTVNAARGDKELALQYSNSFHKQLKENIISNSKTLQ